ncbi:virulence-associated E family protein [Latilactobacillus sakei]|uniref:virulence-associated E family protein n=1 Tax=Latilactobacillus sakei TaxID=1599 RepID=UPI003078BF9F
MQIEELEKQQSAEIITDNRFQGWQSRLDKNDKGQVKYNFPNLNLIFENDENLKGIFSFDSFKNVEVLMHKPVWKRTNNDDLMFTDDDEVQIRNYIRYHYNITGDNTKLYADIIKGKCINNAFNPIKDYLEGCLSQWDGKQRISGLLQKYLGVEDTELMRTAFTTMLVGTVARVYVPGVKFDYMAILAGDQGLGKSSLLAKLGGEWYSDDLQGYSSKDDVQITLGKLIIEDGELSAMKNSRIDQVKRYITKQLDSLRLPYGKRVVTYKRHFTLWGTSNQSTFLYDKTGSRRFLVFKCSKDKRTANVMKDLTAEEVAQVWGEAVHIYRQGYKLFLPDELEEEMVTIRDEYQSTDETTDLIIEYLAILLPKQWYDLPNYKKRSYIRDVLDGLKAEYHGDFERDKVTIREIMSEVFKQDFDNAGNRDYHKQANNVRDIMKSLEDWEYRNVRYGDKVVKGFKREK